MSKFLSFTFTMILIGASFITHAQNLSINSGQTNIDFVAKKPGTLSVQTSSGNGANQCSLGPLSASPTSLCLNNSTTPITITESYAVGGGNFTSPTLIWYYNGEYLSSETGVNSATITVTKLGIYRLVETNGSSDSCWDEISITSTLPITIPANTTLSTGGSVVLNAPDTSKDGTTINTYQWYNGSTLLVGATASTYTASQSGSYYAQTMDNANGCEINTDVVNVNIVAPSSPLNINGNTCTNDTLSITDNSSLVPDSITWFHDDVPIKLFGNSGITVAGGNGSGNGLDQLNQPNGIYLDADKNLYIADYENDRIVKWSAGGASGQVIADSISNINGSKPNDIFVDAQQNLAITTDHGIIVTPSHPVLNNIYRKSFNGFSSEQGNNFAPMMGDNNLNIYVCNTSNSYIERWSPYTGNDSIIGSGLFELPTGIFVDTTHNVLCITELNPNQDDKYTYPMQVVKWDPATNSVSIVAGSSNPTSNHEITWADQLAVDASENIYVADTGSQNIQIWAWDDPENQIILSSGFRPKGMKLDNGGNLYVADATNNQVLEFSSDNIQSLISGSITSIPYTIVAGGNNLGSALNQLNQPEGIFIDADKNIFIADNGNDRIVKWAAGTTSGVVILDNVSRFTGYKNNLKDVWIDKNQNLFFSDSGVVIHVPLPFPASLNLKAANAWGITGDANSNLYISENSGVEKWNPYTSADSLFGKNAINEPNGIYLDASNNIYIGDNLTDSEFNYYGRIVKFAPASMGVVTVGANYSQIGANGGIAIDTAGNIFIADINNDRVLAWKKNATAPVTIVSGYKPWGIKLDNDGNIYVADQTNNRVVMYPPMIKNFITGLNPGVYKAKVSYPGGFTQMTNSITVTNCTLGLQMLNFTARLQKDDVILNWQTAQEINMGYFEIERSIDGVNYFGIANVLAVNNSNINNYSYTDVNIPKLGGAKLYYRLKEVDKDGSFTYSKIVVINLNEVTADFRINPNPVHDLLTINLMNITQPTNIIVIDVNGRRLIKKNIRVAAIETVSLNTSKLAAGTYILQIISYGKTNQQKFIKL